MKNEPSVEAWSVGGTRLVHGDASRQCVGEHARVSLAASLCNLATTEDSRGLGIQNQLLDEMKVEFEEFPGRRVCTDVEREGAPLEYADHPPAALRAAAEEEDRAATSQGLRDRSRSPPQDALSRETAEQARRAHALSPIHPSNHQERRVQAPSPEEPPTRDNRATRHGNASLHEPPAQRPRLECPASAIRWSKADEPGHWTPVTVLEVQEDMWIEADQRCCGSSRLTITSGKTSGSQLPGGVE